MKMCLHTSVKAVASAELPCISWYEIIMFSTKATPMKPK